MWYYHILVYIYISCATQIFIFNMWIKDHVCILLSTTKSKNENQYVLFCSIKSTHQKYIIYITLSPYTGKNLCCLLKISVAQNVYMFFEIEKYIDPG